MLKSDIPFGIVRLEEIVANQEDPTIVFNVAVIVDGNHTSMRFATSKCVNVHHAKAAACACRRYFERCENKHLPFLPEMLGDWQKWRMVMKLSSYEKQCKINDMCSENESVVWMNLSSHTKIQIDGELTLDELKQIVQIMESQCDPNHS